MLGRADLCDSPMKNPGLLGPGKLLWCTVYILHIITGGIELILCDSIGTRLVELVSSFLWFVQVSFPLADLLDVLYNKSYL